MQIEELERFEREAARRMETPGIGQLLAVVTLAHTLDERRLERGAATFDDLYEYLKRTRT